MGGRTRLGSRRLRPAWHGAPRRRRLLQRERSELFQPLLRKPGISVPGGDKQNLALGSLPVNALGTLQYQFVSKKARGMVRRLSLNFRVLGQVICGLNDKNLSS